MPETEVVAVVIEHSFYIKRRIFEVDVVELLKSLGVNVKHVGIESASWPPLYDGERSSVRYTLITGSTSPGRNDGGIDIIGEIGEVTILFQCKNWDNPIGSSVVREMRGVVCQENPETVVSEIARQLANWNIETHQNGRVTSSQGGFNFNVGGVRTIRAPDVAFTPKRTTHGLNALQNWTFRGQPFTPIFVVELGFLVSIWQDNNGQLQENIYSWRWDENNTERHYEHGWRSMNTGQEILSGFVLDVDMIEEAISQQDSGSSDDDVTNIPCNGPGCTATFTSHHAFLKHYQKDHALKRRV
ncbi:3880_t:CDS:2 [Cetraspora pellucida]|uniref:3880_t:CDS:1 n=1 Tax=Cetraspora pellucida TaxID=1433469 RepID=A0A9N9EP46_9GLOM|nr:3880_t:CDS:2 [Cetraspora pellucida]